MIALLHSLASVEQAHAQTDTRRNACLQQSLRSTLERTLRASETPTRGSGGVPQIRSVAEVQVRFAIPAGVPAPIRQAVSRGRVQESIWELRSAGHSVAAQSLESQLFSYLETGTVVSIQPLGGGVSPSFVIEYENGLRGVFKPDRGHWASNSHAEAAAFQLDRGLGIDRVPITVRRDVPSPHRFGAEPPPPSASLRSSTTQVVDKERGSVMLLIENTLTGMSDPQMRVDPAIRFFDVLIGNHDRHAGNYLIMPNGRQIAIDHGIAFDALAAARPIDSISPDDALRATIPSRAFFNRARSLTRESLERWVGVHLDDGQISGILRRRDRWVRQVGGLIERVGEASVFPNP